MTFTQAFLRCFSYSVVLLARICYKLEGSVKDRLRHDLVTTVGRTSDVSILHRTYVETPGTHEDDLDATL
jgi:hypothetical protein